MYVLLSSDHQIFCRYNGIARDPKEDMGDADMKTEKFLTMRGVLPPDPTLKD